MRGSKRLLAPRWVAMAAILPMLAVTGPADASAGQAARQCQSVRTFVPPAATDKPFGITAGKGGMWIATGDTIDRLHEGSFHAFTLDDPTTADAYLAGLGPQVAIHLVLRRRQLTDRDAEHPWRLHGLRHSCRFGRPGRGWGAGHHHAVHLVHGRGQQPDRALRPKQRDLRVLDRAHSQQRAGRTGEGARR